MGYIQFQGRWITQQQYQAIQNAQNNGGGRAGTIISSILNAALQIIPLFGNNGGGGNSGGIGTIITLSDGTRWRQSRPTACANGKYF
ncbi:MAG: hypothetical protein AAFO94_21725, partial [Bacteroidota bacterium]